MNDNKLLRTIRRENLRTLSRELGGDAALANAIDRSAGQISHLIGINPTKAVGEKLARYIEEKLNKPKYWLDRVHGINDQLLETVMAEIDQTLSDMRIHISDDKRRKLVALYYKIVSVCDDTDTILKSLVELAS